MYIHRFHAAVVSLYACVLYCMCYLYNCALRVKKIPHLLTHCLLIWCSSTFKCCFFSISCSKVQGWQQSWRGSTDERRASLKCITLHRVCAHIIHTVMPQLDFENAGSYQLPVILYSLYLYDWQRVSTFPQVKLIMTARFQLGFINAIVLQQWLYCRHRSKCWTTFNTKKKHSSGANGANKVAPLA